MRAIIIIIIMCHAVAQSSARADDLEQVAKQKIDQFAIQALSSLSFHSTKAEFIIPGKPNCEQSSRFIFSPHINYIASYGNFTICYSEPKTSAKYRAETFASEQDFYIQMTSISVARLRELNDPYRSENPTMRVCFLSCASSESCVKNNKTSARVNEVAIAAPIKEATALCDGMNSYFLELKKLKSSLTELIAAERQISPTCQDTIAKGFTAEEEKAARYLLKNKTLEWTTPTKSCILAIEKKDSLKVQGRTIYEIYVHIVYPVGFKPSCASKTPLVTGCEPNGSLFAPASPGAIRILTWKVELL